MAATDLLTLPRNGIHPTADAVPEAINSFSTLSGHITSNNAILADTVLETLLSSHGRGADTNTFPASKFTAQIHPLTEEVGYEVEQYFLNNWNFKTDKERSVFLKAGFPRVTCFYFPEAKYDRIGYACRLLTILFLIDDILENMSLAEGEAYNKKIMDIMSGAIDADRSLPEQYIMSDLCAEMRKLDVRLAEETLNATYIFMRAQTNKSRLTITNLKQYFIYREDDVGQRLLASLMRFTMNLDLNVADCALLAPLERHCGQHISIVNDILSWEKEVKAATTGHSEGAALCSAVQVLADESGLTIEASKRVLWTIAREVENAYIQDASELLLTQEMGEDARAYIRGLVHQMGGNERWSLETKRYHELS